MLSQYQFFDMTKGILVALKRLREEDHDDEEEMEFLKEVRRTKYILLGLFVLMKQENETSKCDASLWHL